MASRIFFNPTAFASRTPFICASLGAGALVLAPPLLQAYRQRYAIRLDSSASGVSPKDWSFSQYQHDAQTPIVKQGGGLNARAVRQLSAGSIIGMLWNTTIDGGECYGN